MRKGEIGVIAVNPHPCGFTARSFCYAKTP
jgi:hypothetical protein